MRAQPQSLRFPPPPSQNPLLEPPETKAEKSLAIAGEFPCTLNNRSIGRLVFIHLQCWEALPRLTIQRQRWIKFRVLWAQVFYRAAKGTNANLQFSAGSCAFLRFPAKIGGFLRKSAVPKCFIFWEKARISENLRLGSVCPLRFVPLSAPWFYTPLALNCQKGQHLPALVAYQKQSPNCMALRRLLSYEGETHPKKPPTQIKTQFAQTISGQFVETVPPLPFKTSRKEPEEFVQTVCAIWVGGFLGGSPSLDLSDIARCLGSTTAIAP